MADPNYDPTEFQKTLRAWMARHGLSQMAAANETGISQGVINRWLKPRGDVYLVQPTIDTLERLAPHMSGVTLLDLKRMTGNLSPTDREKVSNKPLDYQLSALLNDIKTRWEEIDQQERDLGEDVTRSVFKLHHGRTRRPRGNGPPKPKGDPDSNLLMVA